MPFRIHTRTHRMTRHFEHIGHSQALTSLQRRSLSRIGHTFDASENGGIYDSSLQVFRGRPPLRPFPRIQRTGLPTPVKSAPLTLRCSNSIETTRLFEPTQKYLGCVKCSPSTTFI
jgi:hypothetical protein